MPISGEPWELRAITGTEATRVQLELDLDQRRQLLEAQVAPREPDSVGGASEGHLSEAAAAERRGHLSWVVRPDPLPPGVRLRYRFIADGAGDRQQTRWYAVSSATWLAAGGHLTWEGPSNVAARLVPGSIAWLMCAAGPIRVRFSLRLDRGEHVVGFGERFDALDQRGRRLDAVVYEQYRNQGARTYLPMPFAMVVGGHSWGFHVVTSRRSWFDVGRRDPNEMWIEVAIDPRDPALTVQLFSGSPSDVLADFLEETGHPRLPPGWIFRPWMSGNEWNTQARVMAEVERSVREGIPVGVLAIEAWSDEWTYVAFRDSRYPVHPDGAPHRLVDFDFPPDGAWPDPKQMVDQLHGLGIKVLLWQIPLTRARPSHATQAAYDHKVMVARGYAVKKAGGRPYRNRGWWFPAALLPDFTSAEAREWWLAKRRYLIEDVGVDGFKTDGGEHAWGNDLRYADGSRGDAGNNRYPVLYAAAYQELMDKAGRHGITFSRAGFTGSAAYPCHWAGDEASTWEAFRASITAGLTAGASGIFFWGWDLAGFSGEIPNPELYLRAAAAACFCPIMQYHSEYNSHRRPCRDRTPWNIAERTGDPRVLPTYRRFANLRESLVPYLVDQSRRAVEASKPLMRAMFFEVAEDEEIWNWPRQYFLGDSLLVAPVTQPGVGSWSLYLPSGEWVDAWSGQQHAGRVNVQRVTPLEEIPVYVRAEHAERMLPTFRDAAL